MLNKILSLTVLVSLAVPSFAHARDPIATGEEARRMFEALPGPASEEHCTGLCTPGHPCDPVCFSSKNGEEYSCTRTRHTKSGTIEFSCYRAARTPAAWDFAGEWKGHGFNLREYRGDRAELAWADGEPGFTAYYNPNPFPRPRCICSVYDASNGRRLIVEHAQGYPQGGWYRGTPFRIVGSPIERSH